MPERRGYGGGMRLFASIRPPEEVREHLVTALRPIRDDHGPLLRWIDPDQWHVTVAFYGERPDGSVDELAEHIAAAVATTDFPAAGSPGAGPFPGSGLPGADFSSTSSPAAGFPASPGLDLHLRGAGSFSGRTLWIGVGGDVAPLRRLMAACAHDPFAIDDDPDPLLDPDAPSAHLGGTSSDTSGFHGSGSLNSGSRGSGSRSSGSRNSRSRGSKGGDQRERRRAHLTVARLRAREQGGRRDGRRSHRRSAWAGDRRRGRSRDGGSWAADPGGGHGGGYGGGQFDGGYGRDLVRPARHDGASLLHDVVHALSVYAGPSWSTTEIELVSSRLGEGRSGGALHETVATIPFSPGSFAPGH